MGEILCGIIKYGGEIAVVILLLLRIVRLGQIIKKGGDKDEIPKKRVRSAK